MSKGKPIPVRFETDEAAALAELSKRTGLNVADIIRRCLRMLYGEVKRRKSVGFILDLTSLEGESQAPEPDPMPESVRKQSTTHRGTAQNPPPATVAHVECPPPKMKPRGPQVPARTVRATNLHGNITFGVNEQPAEERKVEVKPEDRLKGQPKPKSTRGIRGVSRPGGQAGEK